MGRGTKRGAKYTFRCLSVLGAESALITILQQGDELTVVRIDGRSTASDQDGLACDIECDLVVTGRYRYGARNVFVLEQFDPNAKFK